MDRLVKILIDSKDSGHRILKARKNSLGNEVAIIISLLYLSAVAIVKPSGVLPFFTTAVENANQNLNNPIEFLCPRIFKNQLPVGGGGII